MGTSSLHPPPGPDTQIAFQGNRANSRAGHVHCRPSSVRTPACERGSEPCRRSGGRLPDMGRAVGSLLAFDRGLCTLSERDTFPSLMSYIVSPRMVFLCWNP